MARKRKLTSPQIRRIFQSPKTAKALSLQFAISPQMIYLIRSGRYYGGITRGLKRATKDARGVQRSLGSRIDLNALADAIIDRLIKRLRTVKA
jgi:hypothetical protein